MSGGIDQEQLEQMQKTAFDTVAELQTTSDRTEELTEERSRALSFRATMALNILQLQPSFPFAFPPDPPGTDAEEVET